MSKEFTVTMKYRTMRGKLVTFVGNVVSVPGVDIFATARAVVPGRQKKGQIDRVLRASMVPAF